MTTLGSALGHLADPPREAPYEALRLDLLDRVVQVAAADGTAWVTAWDATSRALADAVLAEARDAIQGAARYARFPSRRVAALLPDAETADALLQRLRAAGIPLETLATRATTPDITRERAAAMEAAWHEARQIALGDLARWRAIAGEIAAWRRPLRGVLLASTVAVVIVAILAAWLGGWLPAPGWFAPIGTWFWSLPWP
ncbi:MAG TPA: hypothetical protein VFN90_03640 [Gemmatimonadales bacterium]|nr:hypothetical protein [Gemmatimonadales bacterium]